MHTKDKMNTNIRTIEYCMSQHTLTSVYGRNSISAATAVAAIAVSAISCVSY